MLTCREVVELMTEYLEGSMDSGDRLRFERHVAICPPCRGFMAQLRHTIAVSSDAPEDAISPDVREALVDTFRNWNKGK